MIISKWHKEDKCNIPSSPSESCTAGGQYATTHCVCQPKVTEVTALSTYTSGSTKKKVVPAEGVMQVLLFCTACAMANPAGESSLCQSSFELGFFQGYGHLRNTLGVKSALYTRNYCRVIKAQSIYNETRDLKECQIHTSGRCTQNQSTTRALDQKISGKGCRKAP